MSVLSRVILITAAAGIGGTGLGGLIGICFPRNSKKIISLMLSYAGGVMLSIVCFDLILNALEPEGAEQMTCVWFILSGILLGYAVIGLLNTLIERRKSAVRLNRHAVRNAAGRQYSSLFTAGVVMACAIALHNVPEGMVIGSAYAAGRENVLSRTALTLAFVIGLHNIPEGMAVSVPLVSGGLSRVKAVLICALSGAPTVLGAVFGYSLGMMGPAMLALSLCFASGAMLYVVFCELLPEAIMLWRSKLPAFAVLVGIFTGLFIVYRQ